MFKILILSLILVFAVTSMQFSLGAYDSAEKTWRGYNPICDDQCLINKGTICGTNVRQCCAPGQCINKLGFTVC